MVVDAPTVDVEEAVDERCSSQADSSHIASVAKTTNPQREPNNVIV